MYVISGEAVQCSFENARVVSMILKTAYTDMHATSIKLRPRKMVYISNLSFKNNIKYVNV